MKTITLIEGEKGQKVPTQIGFELSRLGICDAGISSKNDAVLSGFKKIGLVNIEGYTIEIQPKVKISNVLQLLDPDLKALELFDSKPSADFKNDWTYALIEIFLVQLERALIRGPIYGYKSVNDSIQTVRGRLDLASMSRRSIGTSANLDVIYDDFVIDIAENQILKTAVEVIRNTFAISETHKKKLVKFALMLDGVGIFNPGQRLPKMQIDSRNIHYRSVLNTAYLVLEQRSFSLGIGQNQSRSIVIDMARLFESFIEHEFSLLTAESSLNFAPQHGDNYLDKDRNLKIRPDYAWTKDGQVVALADAKYKRFQEKRELPQSDTYQLFTYCTRHDLKMGHLIYAEAPEFSLEMNIEDDLKLKIHQLDLSLPRLEILGKIKAIYFSIVSSIGNA